MRRVLGCAMLVLWAGVASGNQSSQALEARQAEARRQQTELRERIAELQKDIDKQTSSRDDAASALRESESAISGINRRLDELERQDKVVRAQLATLETQIAKGKADVERHQAELADQLRAQYAGGLSPWAALLSGDNPQEIGRELGYLGYVSQAQADSVRALDASVKRLSRLQTNQVARQAELAELTTETSQKKVELEAQKAERLKVLARIDSELKTQRQQAKTLARNETRLESLVDGLQVEIARQREAERIAREKRAAEEAARRAAEAKAKAERERLAAEQRAKAAEAERQAKALEQVRVAPETDVVTVDAIGNDDAEPAKTQETAPPPQVARRPAERMAPTAADDEDSGPTEPESAEPVAVLKGLSKNLPLPVKGEIQGRFGMERPDGGVWRGIVLRAREGTRVRPVAPGRVAYAGWFNGFGNLLIVDHGQGYLSVYAYNQSLLRQVGDTVKVSDAIATVGATGGQVESGLYFEIRHNGKPVNPQLWLGR